MRAVQTALRHQQPDRLPVDFLATPEIWRRLQEHFGIESRPLTEADFFDPAWEAILQRFEVDCRVISYDQFCRPPEHVLPGRHGGLVERAEPFDAQSDVAAGTARRHFTRYLGSRDSDREQPDRRL